MISFKLYREFGALNSPPVFDAIQKGILASGNQIVNSDEDVSIIWSVLWNGRMIGNKSIYQQSIREKRPILIVEVGNLIRGKTWRLSLNHVNRLGYFGNDDHLDESRPLKLNLSLFEKNSSRKPEILITGQHETSLQWEGQPPMMKWVDNTVKELRKYTDRPIKFRPHPRAKYSYGNQIPGIIVEIPRKIPNTYDNFDMSYNYHCIINHNSGPGVHAAIHGTPVICDRTSLAFPVSGNFQEIESIQLPDRTNWFIKLCHTEWTVEEIAKGMPITRLIPEIERQLKG